MTITTDDLMHMTLEELSATVEARMAADRLSADVAILEALDGDDPAAASRALGGIRSPGQLERVIDQLDREQERRGAWLAWMERCAEALRERIDAGDGRPMGEDGRPFADELAALLASWPEAPRVRVA